MLIVRRPLHTVHTFKGPFPIVKISIECTVKRPNRMVISSSNTILGLKMSDIAIETGHDQFFSLPSQYVMRNHPAKTHMKVKYPSKEPSTE
jgi:hypothetical protein